MARGAFGTVAVRMDNLAHELSHDGLDALTTAVASTVKTEALDRVALDIGTDRRLSGFGRGRSRGKVKASSGYDLTAPGRATVNYRPPGRWGLLEYGSKTNTWKNPRRRGRRYQGGTYTRERVTSRRTVTKAAEDASKRIPVVVADRLYKLTDAALRG